MCDFDPSGEYKAQLVESKSKRRSKASKAMYSAEDEEWAERVKAEMAEKNKKVSLIELSHSSGFAKLIVFGFVRPL